MADVLCDKFGTIWSNEEILSVQFLLIVQLANLMYKNLNVG